MKWKKVREIAEENLLEIFSPMLGYHGLIQIVDRQDEATIMILFCALLANYKFLKSLAAYRRSPRCYWSRNRASSAHLEISAILQQRELSKIGNEQAIAQAETAKTFF